MFGQTRDVCEGQRTGCSQAYAWGRIDCSWAGIKPPADPRRNVESSHRLQSVRNLGRPDCRKTLIMWARAGLQPKHRRVLLIAATAPRRSNFSVFNEIIEVVV